MESRAVEERLVELETRLAYQEATLQVLNEVVTRQQQQIDQLDSLCRRLLERVDTAGGAARGSAVDEIPPHY
jgi:SlyX protein